MGATVDIGRETCAELKHGHAVVGTSKSQLTTLDFTAFKSVLLRCPGTDDPVANAAPVWVGGSGVTADSAVGTGGIPIVPGATITIPIDHPNKLWVISTSASQDIAWVCV